MYRGVGARLVHALKYEGAIWLRPQLGELIRDDPVATAHLQGKVLVPVPLHWRKRLKRGYNQSEIIAASISDVVPDCTTSNLLHRQLHRISQTMLTRSERMLNMEGVFGCRPDIDKKCKYVIIDDVMTTGATLNSAASALRVAGASQISAFTLAHG